MASFRQTLLALFALLAVCGAVAAQAAPMASTVIADEMVVKAVCHCEDGCTATACATPGACSQACSGTITYVGADGGAFCPSIWISAHLTDNSETYVDHTWPPPLQPPRR
jgi:hypothetical protein